MIRVSGLGFAVSLICRGEEGGLALLAGTFNVTPETHGEHVWFINMNREFNLRENGAVSNRLGFSLIQGHTVKHEALPVFEQRKILSEIGS